MTTGLESSSILFTMVNFLFPFWPLLILAPLPSRGNFLAKMLVMWVVVLFIRIALVFSPLPRLNFLIPEPLSTVLFFFVGGAIVIGVMRSRRRMST